MENFNYILILLGCSVILISFCHRLHLPPIIGYLCVGVIVGPGGLRWLPSIEDMHILAEFGIVFLMFTLGLEFSIPRLMATKRTLLGVGSLQVLVCTLVGTIAGWLLDFNLQQSFIIGGALALSSTAIVIKLLREQKEQHSPHGQLSINILLFQDIAAVLFLILIPAMVGDSSSPVYVTFLIAIAKGLGVIIGMAMVGLWLLRPLFNEVAKAHSNELFMIASLLVALTAAGITHSLGLSMALGAFLAGLVLGETEFKHQIELMIRPFRDVLLGLFFVIIGTYLELDQLSNNWHQVLLILIFLLSIKMSLIILVTMLFGKTSTNAALKTGIILAHGGEFSFVILQEAIDNNIVLANQRPAIFSAIVLSALLAPLMIRFNQQLSTLFYSDPMDHLKKKQLPSKLVDHAAELQEHVILCGFGRVGQILARFLDKEKIPWLALDLDPTRISKASVAGEHSFYGDASHPETLVAAGIAKARMVVISFSDEDSALEVLTRVREMRLDLPTFVRTKDDNNLEKFQAAGATEVVPESLESSIMLGSHLLLTLGVPTAKIISKVRRIHSTRYDIIRGFFTGDDEHSSLDVHKSSRRSLHSIVVHEGAAAIGCELQSLYVPGSEIAIKAINRGDKRYNDPKLDMVIVTNDVIVIFASPEEMVIIEEKILQGSNY